MWPSQALNLRSSTLSLLSAGITGMSHHSRLRLYVLIRNLFGCKSLKYVKDIYSFPYFLSHIAGFIGE
jgi:hypothetical protein